MASARAMSGRSNPLSFCVNEIVLFYHPTNHKSKLSYSIGKIRDIRGNQLIIETSGKQKTISIHNTTKLQLRSSDSPSPYDVSRLHARVQVLQDNVLYTGTVVEVAPDGQLRISWDVVAGVGWPDEYRTPEELNFDF